MTEMFAPPAAPGSGIKWENHKGALVLVTVQAIETAIKTAFGDSDAVRADVVVLDGPGKGEEYPDCLIFPKVLQSQLKARIGQKVLGRVGQGQAKPGQSAPWLLEAFTPADAQLAAAWVTAQQQTGFASPTGDTPPW